jgi:uncharacterized protein YndB with AHSA1/START domain
MPIQWPARYAPDGVAATVSNEIAVAAPPGTVWAWLIRASAWPSWYPNCRAMQIAENRTDLAPGLEFRWRTFGVNVRSTVREFEAPSRLAWDGKGFMLDVYHAWLIEPRTRGCWVLTQENQHGLAARAQALVMPKRMFRGHQLWLENLKARAESGMPPGAMR